MTELVCSEKCGCTKVEIKNIQDSVSFVDAMRYLWIHCKNKDTYLDGTPKEVKELQEAVSDSNNNSYALQESTKEDELKKTGSVTKTKRKTRRTS